MKQFSTMVWEGLKNILLLGKALKFREMVQKCALEILKTWKIFERLSEKMQTSNQFFQFSAQDWEK